ncbi:MAG: helix-turn-helix domain-containing protein [Actinomycetota bacterium]
MSPGSLDIGEVVKRSGFTTASLHHYEKLGLIEPVGRRGLRRQYSPDVLDRLALIGLGRAAGFSLADLAQTLPLDRRPGIDRARLVAKASEIDEAINALSALRETLLHVAACPEPDPLMCPEFRKLLDAETHRRTTARGGADDA